MNMDNMTTLIVVIVKVTIHSSDYRFYGYTDLTNGKQIIVWIEYRDAVKMI